MSTTGREKRGSFKRIKQAESKRGTTFALAARGGAFAVLKLRVEYASATYRPFWGVVADGLTLEAAEQLFTSKTA